MLGKQQQESLFFFLDTITELLAEWHYQHQLLQLKEQVNLAVALLEKNFPISIQVWFFIQGIAIYIPNTQNINVIHTWY